MPDGRVNNSTRTLERATPWCARILRDQVLAESAAGASIAARRDRRGGTSVPPPSDALAGGGDLHDAAEWDGEPGISAPSSFSGKVIDDTGRTSTEASMNGSPEAQMLDESAETDHHIADGGHGVDSCLWRLPMVATSRSPSIGPIRIAESLKPEGIDLVRIRRWKGGAVRCAPCAANLGPVLAVHPSLSAKLDTDPNLGRVQISSTTSRRRPRPPSRRCRARAGGPCL